MTDYDDHPKLEGYPIDRDYCRRTDEREDALESPPSGNTKRTDTSTSLSSETNVDIDWSFLFGGNAGDGASSSLDELIDKNAVIENDGRSITRTFYYIQDVDNDKRDQYQRMLKMQDGVGDTTRSVKNAQADKRRWVDAFGSRLDCTDHQREQAKELIKEMNFKFFGNYSSEKVILGIMSLICERDGRFIRHEPAFQRLMQSVELDYDGLRTTRRMVRERSDQFEEYEPDT